MRTYLPIVIALCCLSGLVPASDKKDRTIENQNRARLSALDKVAIKDLVVVSPSEEIVKAYSLDPFYRKSLIFRGFLIVGSENVSDFAFREAAYIIDNVIGEHQNILDVMRQNQMRLGIMAYDEMTTDLPENSHFRNKAYWDRRARGLGATCHYPIVSCGEENLLSFPGDPYASENILIHEFAHTIHAAMKFADPNFDPALLRTFLSARKKGLWDKTYAVTNHSEYWAEGVQSWFDDNRQNDNCHNHVNTRNELEEYDADLAALIANTLGPSDWRYQSPKNRGFKDHLEGYDPQKSPRFRFRPRDADENSSP